MNIQRSGLKMTKLDPAFSRSHQNRVADYLDGWKGGNFIFPAERTSFIARIDGAAPYKTFVDAKNKMTYFGMNLEFVACPISNNAKPNNIERAAIAKNAMTDILLELTGTLIPYIRIPFFRSVKVDPDSDELIYTKINKEPFDIIFSVLNR